MAGCRGAAFLLERPAASLRNSAAIDPFTAKIAIAIAPAAHQAIKASLLGTSDASPLRGGDGLIRIWLDYKFVDRLGRCELRAKATAM